MRLALNLAGSVAIPPGLVLDIVENRSPEDLLRRQQGVGRKTRTRQSQKIAGIGPGGPETVTEAGNGSPNVVSAASGGSHKSDEREPSNARLHPAHSAHAADR